LKTGLFGKCHRSSALLENLVMGIMVRIQKS
jgi:hypothetical protein